MFAIYSTSNSGFVADHLPETRNEEGGDVVLGPQEGHACDQGAQNEKNLFHNKCFMPFATAQK